MSKPSTFPGIPPAKGRLSAIVATALGVTGVVAAVAPRTAVSKALLSCMDAF